jgi:hypothetical protein
LTYFNSNVLVIFFGGDIFLPICEKYFEKILLSQICIFLEKEKEKKDPKTIKNRHHNCL